MAAGRAIDCGVRVVLGGLSDPQQSLKLAPPPES